jgi:hypothetical protein
MAAKIQILGMRGQPNTTGATVINTCSNAATGWERDLSPFIIGPCNLYGNHRSQNMENGWQYSKLYKRHADAKGQPTTTYWNWAKQGFNNPRAVRYPMGRGARPLYAWWDGRTLPYIEARKEIYGPLYAEAVLKTAGWTYLKNLYQTQNQLILRDWDGHDHDALGLTLTQVLNNPRRKMGHAFVLKMLLTQDAALQQMKLRP